MNRGTRRGAVALIAANGLAKPLWFAYMAVLCVRHLSPYQFGLLATALSAGQIIGSVVDAGMTPYAVREASADPAQAPALLRHLLPVRVLSMMAGVGLALAGAAVLGYSPGLQRAMAFGTLYCGALAVRAFLRAFLEARGWLEPEGVFLLLERSFVVVAGTVALLATNEAVPVLASMAGAMLTVSLIQGLWTLRHVAPPSHAEQQESKSLRGTLQAAAPLALASALGLLYYRSDIVIIEALLGANAAGWYGAPYQLLNGLSLLPSIVVGSILYPRLSRLSGDQNREDFARLLWRSLVVLALAGGVVGAAASVGARPLMSWIGGDSYTYSGDILRILAWTFPFNCTQYLLSVAAMAKRKEILLNATLGIAFAFNVSANLLLLPQIGIWGAALSTIVSEALVTALLAAGLWRYAGLDLSFFARTSE